MTSAGWRGDRSSPSCSWASRSIAFTPLKAVVEGRAENQHSNEGREFLYAETVKAVADSPVIGYGGPRPYGGPKIIPQHGDPGPVLAGAVLPGGARRVFFVAFLVKMTRATRRGPVVTFWCHVTLTIAAGADLRLRHDPGAAAPHLIVGPPSAAARPSTTEPSGQPA